MKKLVLGLVAVLACGSAAALPLGNPTDASMLTTGVCREGHCAEVCDPCISWCDAWSVRFGFYGDYVFNRHLQIDHDDRRDVIEDAELFTNALYLAGNMYDRVDLFVTLGASNLFMETNGLSFGETDDDTSSRFEIATTTNFSWSVGVRATLWECNCWEFGGEFQYFSASLPICRVTNAEESLYNDRVLSANYDEWQIGFGVSRQLNCLVPYLGVMWSGVKVDMDNARIDFPEEGLTSSLFNLENQKTFAWCVGVTMLNCAYSSITVEARFSGEKALHVNGQIRF